MSDRGASTVNRNLTRWRNQKVREVSTVCKVVIEPMLERRAKQNAPWTDRTGNARRGLKADTVTSASSVVVMLSHSVEYGIYLEMGYSGRFAILLPTMRESTEEIRMILQAAMGQ